MPNRDLETVVNALKLKEILIIIVYSGFFVAMAS